ncbi:MAG: hypothetical protein H5T65_11040 [Chloroflexi bacterium]|nr:hypothetical protein [Chloroflexota bacterium]
MESIIVLGCILDKSSTTLRLTSDPKERMAAAVVAAIFGVAAWLVILLGPFSRLGWAGLIVFGCAGAAAFLFAFLVGLCRTEIEFDISQHQVVRRRVCRGQVWSVSVLPLGQLETIRVVEKEEDTAELQWVRTDGRVWARWAFLIKPLAEETHREIRAWLREHSP